MLTSEQIRAAMCVLRWSRRELSEKTGVSPRTIQRIAEGDGVPSVNAKTLETIQAELEQGDDRIRIKFVDDIPVGIRIIEKK